MGIVYKARHVEDQRMVALKVVSGRATASDRRSARFRREIRVASAIRSPYVVRALDSGRVGDRDFLVMELIRGRTLDWWIKANRRLPIRWACECARQVAIGLQHVHESGLIHRDIKPSNIMVSGVSLNRRPRVRILDLGLGRFAGQFGTGEDLTRDGRTVGTLDYMAPEQLQDNRSVDNRSDIYALGCTLFEALTGRQPFEGRDLGEKMLAKLTGDPTPVERLRADTPADLVALLLQMMSRTPDGRPATPKDVAEALRRFSIRQQVRSALRTNKSMPEPLKPILPTATSTLSRLRRPVADAVAMLRCRLVQLIVGVVRPIGRPRLRVFE
jgi:serine/threonine protein kinase